MANRISNRDGQPLLIRLPHRSTQVSLDEKILLMAGFSRLSLSKVPEVVHHFKKLGYQHLPKGHSIRLPKVVAEPKTGISCQHALQNNYNDQILNDLLRGESSNTVDTQNHARVLKSKGEMEKEAELVATQAAKAALEALKEMVMILEEKK